MEPAIKHNFKALYIFYSFGVILFIISAIILIYYSLGYRYDFDNKQVFQTGILRLSPIGNNYEIFVNDKPIPSNKTQKTTELTNLLPKTHHIKISAPDYQDWNKDIEISSQKIFNEENILLIPNNPKINDQIAFNKYAFNPDNNLLAFTTSAILNTTNIKNPDNNTEYSNINITLNSELKWLDPQLLGIINSNPEETLITVFNPFNENITQLTIPYSIEPHQLIGINPQQSNQILIFNQNQVIEYDLNNKESESILFANISNPKLNNNQLYLSQNQTIIVHNFFLNSTQTFPISEITNFYLTPYPEYIILSTAHDNTLYDLNQQQEIFSFSGNINEINENQELNILIKTDNELIVIDFTNQPITYQTILRISENIEHAAWINDYNIAYSSNQELRRIGIDGTNNQIISSSESGFSDIIISKYIINAVLSSNDLLLLQSINLDNQTSS